MNTPPPPQELETIEDQWHTETKELMELVNRLQEENRRIKQADLLRPSTDADTKLVPRNRSDPSSLNESDFQKLQRKMETQRGQMEKQRDELMCRDQEIEEKNTEIENVSGSNYPHYVRVSKLFRMGSKLFEFFVRKMD